MNSDRTTISLRLPRELHQTIAERAGVRGVNAAIVSALAQHFSEAEVGEAAATSYLDAIDDDVLPRARVIARFQLAAAERANALDVVILDADISRRILEVVGDERRIHGAARQAIETAFPGEGTTWGEVAEELRGVDLSGSPKLSALQQSIERRIAEYPALAKTIAP